MGTKGNKRETVSMKYYIKEVVPNSLQLPPFPFFPGGIDICPFVYYFSISRGRRADVAIEI
jgi:hypothetical protein